ncbi:MAG: hypothetical protein WAQ33_14085 [Gaiellaceae bacterium]
MQDATRRHTKLAQGWGYGYGWWVLGGRPAGFAGLGYGGQAIAVFPQQHLVVVVTGSGDRIPGSCTGSCCRHCYGETLMVRKAPTLDVLLTELEETRAAYGRAELRARTYMVEQGVLDQTHADVPAALARLRQDTGDPRPTGQDGAG